MEVVTETASRSASRAWPPIAERHGAEPSLPAILLILLGATWATHALGGLLPHHATPMDGALSLVAVNSVRLAIWVSIVAALAWWRPAGFGRGTASAWGVVPFVAASFALVIGGWPGDVPNGTPFALALAASTALGALREEVVFRGFLFHGLSRRVGGAAAVVVASGLFALSHVPRYVREERTAAQMVGLMIVIFCLGMLLSRIRAATGSIWLPAGIHTMWNLAVAGATAAAPPAPISLAYAAPFAVGAVLFVALALPRLWPRTFGTLGAFRILGSDRPAARAAS